MTNPMTTESKPHPNLKGTMKRVRLAGGPFVDVRTVTYFGIHKSKGLSQGEIIDQLVDHAISTGFKHLKP